MYFQKLDQELVCEFSTVLRCVHSEVSVCGAVELERDSLSHYCVLVVRFCKHCTGKTML